MNNPDIIIFYVEDITASVEFYGGILEREPAFCSPEFTVFMLDNGMKFGLWLKETVAPEISKIAVGSELSFPVENKVSLEDSYEMLKAKGLSIVQEVTEMSFGTTFVAVDTDGHRLRFYVPA